MQIFEIYREMAKLAGTGRRTSAGRAQPPPPGPASWWALPGSAETTWATQGGQGLPNGGPENMTF